MLRGLKPNGTKSVSYSYSKTVVKLIFNLQKGIIYA